MHIYTHRFLVCSTALRGADMETLKHLLLSSAAVSRSRDMSVPTAASAPPWLPVLYDWYVRSALLLTYAAVC
jgi:hypothetical protein